MKKYIIGLLALMLLVSSVFAMPYGEAKSKAKEGVKAGFNYAIALKNPSKEYTFKLVERGGMFADNKEDWEIIAIDSEYGARKVNKYVTERSFTKELIGNNLFYEFGKLQPKTQIELKALYDDKDYIQVVSSKGLAPLYISTRIWVDETE